MKHYKSVKLLSHLRMSSSLNKRKAPPIENFLPRIQYRKNDTQILLPNKRTIDDVAGKSDIAVAYHSNICFR